MSKIIVTGGAGFIGSGILWRLNQLGHDDILIVDRADETDKWKNLAPLKFADYIDADDFLDDLSLHKDADVIFHMGACSSTTETDADYMLRNNYQYTKDLAEFAVANDIRFVYASSAATYGDGSAGMNDGTDDLNRLRPLNVYGYSKHLFDQYAARNGMFDRVVGLKYFNVFGPNEDHKGDMRSLVNKAFDQINGTVRHQGRRAWLTSPMRSSTRWINRRTSSSSTCPSISATAISITPRPISPASAAPDITPRPLNSVMQFEITFGII